MGKRKSDFDEIRILKEQYDLRIHDQEVKIKSHFSEFSDHLTGVTLFNRLKKNLFSGSGLAFKLGFLAVNMIRNRMTSRKRSSK